MRLDERPVPGKLAVGEDEGGKLGGRWVSSHELQAGDVIYTRSGRTVRIVWLEQRYEQLPVCNLTVDGLPNFAVGVGEVLVHNRSNTDPGSTNKAPRGANHPSVRSTAEIGREAHRQLQVEGSKTWKPEQRIELPDGTVVRKDGVGIADPNQVRIIKPDTPSTTARF